MSEFRKDPVVGRWVIVATERARRPGNFVDLQHNGHPEESACPFCDNHEQELYSVRNSDGHSWRIKVVPNGTPVLKTDAKFQRRGRGLYDVINGYGYHDVIIETPQHIANMADLDVGQIRLVLETYVVRFNEFERNPNIQYALAYKNYGWAAGSRRIGHSRSQIIASSVNPLRVKEKLVGAKRYFEYHDRCLYCDMIRQELDTKKRVVSETDHFVVLSPFATRFPFELIILPKEHHCDFSRGVLGKEEELAGVLKDILLRFKVGLEDSAYNYVIQTAPFRHSGKGNRWHSIEQDYHWHIEIMPRLARTAGFERGSGFYICAIPPEDTAEFLREVKIDG